MARIHLKQMRHSYLPAPTSDEDWAVKSLDIEFKDGGAYALLGPSGCGKSTLLNIISGIVAPSEGQVLFDGDDVTSLPPDKREIAQVFQFPVIYDTMSVYDNLAFPLRNRGVAEADVKQRVEQIAEMLELTEQLKTRAANLPPDSKQKISMGRGLVRRDVNVIMFDEPLTVIDPHLKWKLRSKLKELHQEVGVTMIYVTHDQTEALTFADEVVLMQSGEVLQVGTPVQLFERPEHTFVGHFIGSPGMNVVPCRLNGGAAFIGATPIALSVDPPTDLNGATTEIGVRPEHVRFARADENGLPVEIVNIADVGRRRIVETRYEGHRIFVSLGADEEPPAAAAQLAFEPQYTQIYANGRLATVGGQG